MKWRIPYHVLNTLMILGGVGFMLAMLNLVPFLYQVKVIHFLGLIGGAIALKYLYGMIKPKIADPIMDHPLARKFFYLGMAILATALVFRKYDVPYYNVLMYIDIVVQTIALAISYSAKIPDTSLTEEILDT